MSENTEMMNQDAAVGNPTPEENSSPAPNGTPGTFVPPEQEQQEDNLLELAPEKLAAMLRDKRKAEASVRSKLRETEAERDQLASSVTGFRRQAFAEAAKDSKMHESALDDVLAAVNLEDVLGDDGTVDPVKVGETLKGLRQTHPHYFERRASVSGIGAGGSPTIENPASWSDVLHR